MTDRRRPRSISIDKEVIAERIKKFYDKDLQERDVDRDQRIQRYAKYRGWTEGRDYIGEHTSDASIPDIMGHSLKTQDTLHNAVMATRPVMTSKAVNKNNKDNERDIDDLLDYQFFVEQKGEHTIGEAAECFVNDGVFTMFIPWVREEQKVVETYNYPMIPEDVDPETYFLQILNDKYKNHIIDGSGWDYRVTDEKKTFKVSFYTDEGRDIVQMLVHKMSVVFDGPKPIVKDYEQVLHPHRAANLQRPCPSNPGGSAHVIMIDNPHLDEIISLKKNGFYDLMTEEDMEKLGVTPQDRSEEDEQRAKDDMQGTTETQIRIDGENTTLTRLIVFDMYDVDGDGIYEDVIWWYLLETKTLLKAKYMTEMYPSDPPRRPFAEAAFLPVKGRRVGISLPEMLEGLHDITKQVYDQTLDNGTMETTPFGFYRATSNIKQETMRLWAGELYPLSNPKDDIYFPQISSGSQAFGFNLLTINQQWQDRLTTQGDLQMGGIPAGKSSALRTSQNMQAILAQGEARPERILRRFFLGLAEMYLQMHLLNRAFLPNSKKYVVTNRAKVNDDPYKEIKRQDVDAKYDFEFKANVLNTSKIALQQGLEAMMSAYLNPLSIQMGVVTPENFYRMMKDYGKAMGQDPEASFYITPPSPQSSERKILAEEAISAIMDGQIPNGIPLEPAVVHLQKLQEFVQSEAYAYIDTPEEQAIFAEYFRKVSEIVQQEQQQQALMAAAQQFQAGRQGTPGPQGAPPQQDAMANQQLNPNELLDESLPSAGGGGNV